MRLSVCLSVVFLSAVHALTTYSLLFFFFFILFCIYGSSGSLFATAYI